MSNLRNLMVLILVTIFM